MGMETENLENGCRKEVKIGEQRFKESQVQVGFCKLT